MFVRNVSRVSLVAREQHTVLITRSYIHLPTRRGVAWAVVQRPPTLALVSFLGEGANQLGSANEKSYQIRGAWHRRGRMNYPAAQITHTFANITTFRVSTTWKYLRATLSEVVTDNKFLQAAGGQTSDFYPRERLHTATRPLIA